MAEHRRSMQALRRAATAAASKAEVTAAARQATQPVDEPSVNVTSLAAARARRAGHPAGTARAQ